MNENGELQPIVATRNIIGSQVDQRPSAVYLAGLARSSRRTMGQALNAMAMVLSQETDSTAVCHMDVPWHLLRFQHTAALRSHLAERYSFSTANKMLSALRGVLKAAWRLGLMSAEDYQAAAAVPNVKGERAPAGRALAVSEVQQLLAACGGGGAVGRPAPASATASAAADAQGRRDAAVIAILYACGLRRAELVGLDVADYDPHANGGTLRVRRGKGNKERLVPVAAGAAVYLDGWLEVRGGSPGPLFHALSGRVDNGRVDNGRVSGGRLSTQTVYDILRARSEAAGVRPLSPHDFRRTFVSLLLDAGEDIVTVQKLAGHASVETTARYDRRGEDVKRRAVERLQW